MWNSETQYFRLECDCVEPSPRSLRGTSHASFHVWIGFTRDLMETIETMEVSRSESERHPINLHDLERWASLAAAGAVMAYGFSRRTAPGVALAVAATPLVYRGLSGRWPFEDGYADDTRHALSGSRGIHVRESVRIERRVDEIYTFWRQLENLPRVLTHLEHVNEFADGRSHWMARGPADLGVEWDAEIINEIDNKLIAWRSLPHSDVVTAGSVNFRPVRGGRATELSVHLQYEPPAGRAGAFFARIFGREPSQTIREDLRRLKQVMEAGEIPRASTGDPII
jgi:uncharacterized membrane protein